MWSLDCSLIALNLDYQFKPTTTRFKHYRTTHKVRGLERYLSYQQLPETNEDGKAVKPEQAKRQRRFEIQSDAYKIYASETEEEAQQELGKFIHKWEKLEPKAIQVFLRDFELTLTFLLLINCVFVEFTAPSAIHRRSDQKIA